MHDVSVATVAKLHPMHLQEAQSKRSQTSLRMHGSFLLPLRRPYRTSELSRPYISGDPLAMIDWKAFARTDQLIVREQRNQASALVAIGLDGSESMHWPQADGLPDCAASKFEIAVRLALHLAHRHLRAGDQVQLWLVSARNEPKPNLWWPCRTAAEILQAYEELQRAAFAPASLQGFFRLAASKARTQRRLQVAYWLGDTLGAADHLGFLAQAQQRVLFHTLSSLETDITWTREAQCYAEADGDDKGWQNRREFLGRQLKKDQAFAAAFTQWQQQHEDKLRASQGQYFFVTEKTELSTYLNFVSLLNKR